MNEPEVFIKAEHALKAVVDQIRDDQWPMEMPPDFATSGVDGKITLREVINYHAYDDAWVPDMLAGRTMAEVGNDAFKGDLLGDNPKASFAGIVAKACAAAEALPEKDLDRTAHCSYGDFPVREYLVQITSFRALRAHDIAKVIGANTALPADLVQDVWDQLSPRAEEWRAIGVFGPMVEVPADAPLQHRLLALTGRQP
ncbi:MAG: hypothetical protein H7Y32_13785 [Chloroflexales bacterium]|nr:hypothetical protein [Chloroflexales bacterium]